MMWILIGAGLLVVAGIVVFFRWKIETTDALVLGRCTTCGRALKYKMRTETVTRMLGGSPGIQRAVEVVDHYCPKCKVVVKADALGELKRARQEMGGDGEANETPQKKGERLYRSGRHAEALRCFQQMLEQDRGNILGHLWISDCYREMHDYDKALETIAAGLQVDPNDERYPTEGLFKQQGQLYLHKGNIIAAVRSFKEAARRHGFADVVPFNYLRATYAHSGFTTEADFVTKLKQRMQPLTLTDEADAEVRRLCEACDTGNLRGELWSIADLHTIFG
jgi:lipopolysaccharide biosynthesis regulator YciM